MAKRSSYQPKLNGIDIIIKNIKAILNKNFCQPFQGLAVSIASASLAIVGSKVDAVDIIVNFMFYNQSDKPLLRPFADSFNKYFLSLLLSTTDIESLFSFNPFSTKVESFNLE